MSGDPVGTVWNDLAERVGDDLRAVTRYGATDYETRMREDVRAAYTAAESEAVVDDAIITQLGLPDTERAFKTGQLRAVVRVFDEAWILTRPDAPGSKSGIIVSIERGGEIASMDDVEWCLEYLDEEVAPLLD